jgi:hypothetical protein
MLYFKPVCDLAELPEEKITQAVWNMLESESRRFPGQSLFTDDHSRRLRSLVRYMLISLRHDHTKCPPTIEQLNQYLFKLFVSFEIDRLKAGEQTPTQEEHMNLLAQFDVLPYSITEMETFIRTENVRSFADAPPSDANAIWCPVLLSDLLPTIRHVDGLHFSEWTQPIESIVEPYLKILDDRMKRKLHFAVQSLCAQIIPLIMKALLGELKRRSPTIDRDSIALTDLQLIMLICIREQLVATLCENFSDTDRIFECGPRSWDCFDMMWLPTVHVCISA